MKKLLLSSVAAIAIGGIVYAQAVPSVQDAVESGIEKLNADGANITYSSSEVGSNNSLRLTDVVINPEDGDVTISADWIQLAPSTNVPGEVQITVSPVVTFLVDPDDRDPTEFTMESDSLEAVTNWVLGAAGTPQFSMTADSLTISGGGADHPILKRLNVSPRNLSAMFNFDEGTRNAEANIVMSAIDLDYAFVDPEGGLSETTTIAETLSVTFAGTGLPEDDDEFEEFLRNGGSMELTTSSGPSKFNMAVSGGGMPMTMSGEGGSGTLLAKVADGAFRYDAQFGETNYVITPDPNAMPLPPFEVSVGGGSMNLASPLIESDEPKNAQIGLVFRDLVVSDSVWGMIDPAATLPRDPATLEIDLDADVQLFQPVSAASEAASPLEVGQVENVDINRIFLTIAGATVEAMGSVAFNNEIGPVPVPNGAVDISADGVQGLTQKLVDLGLVEQMQAGMVMGMMMAFGQPGEEPDTFTSKIEFKDGAILANGQPIQ